MKVIIEKMSKKENNLINGYYEYALKGDSQKTGMAVVPGYVNL